MARDGPRRLRRPPASLEAVIRRLRRLPERQPERRLLAAIMLDAIEELRASWPGGEEASRRADVVAWVSATDVRWPLSFVSVCDALDVDAVALRAALLGPSRPSRSPVG